MTTDPLARILLYVGLGLLHVAIVIGLVVVGVAIYGVYTIIQSAQ